MIIGYSRNFVPAEPPSTGLTFRFDPSDLTTLWKTRVPASVPLPCYSDPASADGDIVKVVNSIVPASPSDWIIADNGGGTAPVLRLTSPGLAKSCLEYDGSNDFGNIPRDRSDNGPIGSVSWFGNQAKTFFIAFRLNALPATGQQFGLFQASFGSSFGCRIDRQTHSPTTEFECYISSGGFKIVWAATPLAINTNYIGMWRQDSSNIYCALNNDSEQSLACGTVGNFDGIMACLDGPSSFFNGRIGEICAWNVALSGADLSAAWTYFMNKWL